MDKKFLVGSTLISKPKRRREKLTAYPLSFKQEAVRKFNLAKKKNSYLTKSEYAEELGVRKQTFCDWFALEVQQIDSAGEDRRKKMRKGEYPEIEAYLVRYLNAREELFKEDKLGLHYEYIKDMVLEEAARLVEAGHLEYQDFKASNRWIQNVCLRNGFVNFKAHGEGGDVDEESATAAMKKFTEECT